MYEVSSGWEKYSNEELAEMFTGELLITPGVPDELDEQAAQRAWTQSYEVLTQLDGVRVLTQAQKERAASIMGQYAFDIICALLVDGQDVDPNSFPLDQIGQLNFAMIPEGVQNG